MSKDLIKVFDEQGELTPTIITNLVHWEESIKRANELREHYKEIIQDHMEKHGIKSFKNDDIEIVYVEPTTRTSFDSKKLKDDDFETYLKYVRESEVKGSVRIKCK